jgi:hypothetical protein
MNLLYITLALATLHHAFAGEYTLLSSPPPRRGFTLSPQTRKVHRFEDAIESQDWNVAKKVFTNGGNELRRLCSEALVKKSSIEELNKLLKGVATHDHAWLTQAILTGANPSELPQIFKGLEETIESASWGDSVARDENVVCRPESLVFFFEHNWAHSNGRQNARKHLNYAVRALYWSEKYSCLKPLITSLKGSKVNKGECGKIIASMPNEAFQLASTSFGGIQPWLEGFYEDLAVSRHKYALAMCGSYGTLFGRYGKTFKWLLAHANEDDLHEARIQGCKVVKELPGYAGQIRREGWVRDKDFDLIMEQEFRKIQAKGRGPGRTTDSERASKAQKRVIKETFEEIPGLEGIDQTLGIIGSYLGTPEEPETGGKEESGEEEQRGPGSYLSPPFLPNPPVEVLRA